jgi:hypothetical protein
MFQTMPFGIGRSTSHRPASKPTDMAPPLPAGSLNQPQTPAIEKL